MNMTERMRAFIQGEEFDLVPFAQYDTMAPAADVWELLGRDNICQLKWTKAHSYKYPNCKLTSQETEVDGNRGCVNILETPKGVLREIIHYDPVLNSPAVKEHYIKNIKDYEPFLAYLRDVTVIHDPAPLYNTLNQLGSDGLAHCSVGRSPYQQMWIQWVGMEDLAWHMVEAGEILEECFSLLHKLQLDAVKVICKDPIPYYVIGDNITAPMISPDLFEKYCMPAYVETAQVMSEENVPLVVHMDGELKPLWDLIGKTPVNILDSFSPYPDNDTSAAQAVKLWPDKKFMLNFPSSFHMGTEKEIYDKAMEILNQAGRTGRLQIQISENIPPDKWRGIYSQIFKAIKNYGDPFRK